MADFHNLDFLKLNGFVINCNIYPFYFLCKSEKTTDKVPSNNSAEPRYTFVYSVKSKLRKS